MSKTRLTRGKLLAAAAPLAAVPLVGKLALESDARCRGHDHSSHIDSRALVERERSAMGHAAMIGEEVPAVGGPSDLDALLYPPPARPYQPGRVREYITHRDRRRARDRSGRLLPGMGLQRDRSRPGDPCDGGRQTPREVRERRVTPAHDPLPRDPSDEHGRRLRGRRARRSLHVRVRSKAGRPPPLPLPRDAPQEAHPQGPLRRVHHRSEGAETARAGARHGHERLRHRRRRREQLLHRQRTLVLLRPVSDPGEALGARADLPREPHRVRPHQLVPPARGLLPLPADRHGRELGVHGHRDAVPGPARRDRDRSSRTPGRSCSTRTSPSSPSSAGWGSSRSSTSGSAARRRPTRAASTGGSGPSSRCSSSRSQSAPSCRAARRWPSSSARTRRPPTSSTSDVSSSRPARSASRFATRSRTTSRSRTSTSTTRSSRSPSTVRRRSAGSGRAPSSSRSTGSTGSRSRWG